MLSLRSKIIVAIAVALGLALVLDHLDSRGAWAEPRAEDWYIGWIIFGILGIGAVATVIIDVREI
jgi:hypothetical protein